MRDFARPRDRETSGLRPKAALSNSSLVQCEWGLIILVSLLLSRSFDKEVKALIEKDIVQTGRNQKNPILQWSFFLISLQFLFNGRFYTRGRIIRREGPFVCTTKQQQKQQQNIQTKQKTVKQSFRFRYLPLHYDTQTGIRKNRFLSRKWAYT